VDDGLHHTGHGANKKSTPAFMLNLHNMVKYIFGCLVLLGFFAASSNAQVNAFHFPKRSKHIYERVEQRTKLKYVHIIMKHNPDLKRDDVMNLSMADFEKYLSSAFQADGMSAQHAKEKAHLAVQNCT
jgi:hypothetical protein